MSGKQEVVPVKLYDLLRDAERILALANVGMYVNDFLRLPVAIGVLANAFSNCNTALTNIAERELDPAMNGIARGQIVYHREHFEREFKDALKARFKIYLSQTSVRGMAYDKNNHMADWIPELQKGKDGRAYHVLKKIADEFIKDICTKFKQIVAYKYLSEIIGPRVLSAFYGKEEARTKPPIKVFDMTDGYNNFTFSEMSWNKVYG